MLRIIGIFFSLTYYASLFANTEPELRKAMKGYEGRWLGHFTIHSAATGYTETFPVEQQFWMADGKLHGIAVSDRDSGLQSARSMTYIVEGKLASEITTGETVERYLGVIHEGGILWLPANIQRANDQQLKETVVLEKGVRHLKTEGFDTFSYEGKPAHLVYRGDLKFQD